jgi:hypothetical protein|eukprot:COSAG01_NODE_299_length_19246_cov_62.028827_12_plen_92_part_00
MISYDVHTGAGCGDTQKGSAQFVSSDGGAVISLRTWMYTYMRRARRGGRRGGGGGGEGEEEGPQAEGKGGQVLHRVLQPGDESGADARPQL